MPKRRMLHATKLIKTLNFENKFASTIYIRLNIYIANYQYSKIFLKIAI